MFCPTCGLTEERLVQYCRSCGTDLRAIRTSLASPDPAVTTAGSARDEIGRALAARIRDLANLSELEEALPAIEKFMESPVERRLRRIRAGTITAAIGLGATVFFGLFAIMQHDMLFAPGLGVVLFLIGIGTILNGMWLTLPPDAQANQLNPPDEAIRQFLSGPGGTPALNTGEHLAPPGSVTENTTRHLGSTSVNKPDERTGT